MFSTYLSATVNLEFIRVLLIRDTSQQKTIPNYGLNVCVSWMSCIALAAETYSFPLCCAKQWRQGLTMRNMMLMWWCIYAVLTTVSFLGCCVLVAGGM